MFEENITTVVVVNTMTAVVNTTTAVVNTTMAAATTAFGGYPQKPLTTEEWFNIMAFVIILCTGMVGNAFVVYVYGVKRRRRSSTDWLILYLGVIDFLASMLNPPLYIYWTVTHYSRWDFGYIGCKVFPMLGPVMTCTSSGILLIFALDRFLAIVTPFYGTLSWKTISVLCFINTVLSISAYVHYILALQIHPVHGFCYVPAVEDPNYAIPNCTLIILRLSTFACVFSFTNVRIFLSLRRSGKTCTIAELRTIRYKQSRRIVRVLLMMGIVFTVLVFPRELFYLYFNMSWVVQEQGMMFNSTTLKINAWLKVAHTANSCANVFIYSHMQTVYRKQIFRVLAYLGCCKTAYMRQNFSVTQNTEFVARSPTLQQRRREIFGVDIDISEDGEDVVFFQRAQRWKKKRLSKLFL